MPIITIAEPLGGSLRHYFFAYTDEREGTFVRDSCDTLMAGFLGWLQAEHNLSGATA